MEETKTLENQEAQTQTEEHPQEQEQETKTVEEAKSTNTTDWKAEARKWEARAKENKAVAQEFETYKQEMEKKLEESKIDMKGLVEQLKVYKHAKDVKEWCEQVAEETDVPIAVLETLKPETLEGLQAEAEKIAPYFKKSVAPTVVSDTGVSNQIKAISENAKIANELFSSR